MFGFGLEVKSEILMHPEDCARWRATVARLRQEGEVVFGVNEDSVDGVPVKSFIHLPKGTVLGLGRGADLIRRHQIQRLIDLGCPRSVLEDPDADLKDVMRTVIELLEGRG